MAEEKNSKKQKSSERQEMTLEEAKAYRASLYKPQEIALSEEEKREQFRIFWAQAKFAYGKQKDLEDVLWAHLKASKYDELEKFEDGLNHFGLKKII